MDKHVRTGTNALVVIDCSLSHPAGHKPFTCSHCVVRLYVTIGVREGILLWGRKKFALKIAICPKNKQFALKLTF